MRNFHVALTGASDFDDIERLAAEKKRPRHSVPVLARQLGARLYQPDRDAR